MAVFLILEGVSAFLEDGYWLGFDCVDIEEAETKTLGCLFGSVVADYDEGVGLGLFVIHNNGLFLLI